MTLPKKIQKLRKERGLSQEQLAEALGIAREQRRKNLLRKLKRLLLYCGVPFLLLRISMYLLPILAKPLVLPIGVIEMFLLIPYFCSFIGYFGLFLAGFELWRYFKAET